MDDALHRRLDAIERRQTWILALLVLPYALGALSFLLADRGTAILVGVGGLLLLFAGGIYLGFSARRPSRSRR